MPAPRHQNSKRAGPIPSRAFRTLQLIDAGEWPPNDGSGTKGGSLWFNRGGMLPSVAANGSSIHYRIWDVNHKQPGVPRDGERIITGDDGSVWYTGDGAVTFSRMR